MFEDLPKRKSRARYSLGNPAALVGMSFVVIMSLAMSAVFPLPWSGQHQNAAANETLTHDSRAGAAKLSSISPESTMPKIETAAMNTGSSGLITTGPSRNKCLTPYFVDTGVKSLEAAVSHFENETRSVVTCISTYLSGALTWTEWSHPWFTNPKYGYTSWVAANPQVRQLILGINLIPRNLSNLNDPLTWEISCADGNFNSYATQLGRSLVHAGLQNSVIRLGPEMNGKWEADYVGDTTHEQALWANCFANEVSSLRQATGEHFLIDWNPNACIENFPFAHFYPGNFYVDIVGLDFFNVSCVAPKVSYTFRQLANEQESLTIFQRFATLMGKPMSLPEWGYLHGPPIDDPGYFTGIGSTFAKGNFAFESYFDYQTPYPVLGPKTPLSLAAFQRWFGVAATGK
jgi:hypothetical protein